MDTLLESHFPRTNPKSRLFHIVKEVPTNGIPKIWSTPIFGIPEIWTIFTLMPIYGIPFIQHIISVSQFVEFQKQALISKFSICVFPGVLPIFEIDRFLEFQQQGLFGQYPDFWNSNNMGIACLPIPCSQGKMLDCSSVLGYPKFLSFGLLFLINFVVH